MMTEITPFEMALLVYEDIAQSADHLQAWETTRDEVIDNANSLRSMEICDPGTRAELELYIQGAKRREGGNARLKKLLSVGGGRMLVDVAADEIEALRERCEMLRKAAKYNQDALDIMIVDGDNARKWSKVWKAKAKQKRVWCEWQAESISTMIMERVTPGYLPKSTREALAERDVAINAQHAFTELAARWETRANELVEMIRADAGEDSWLKALDLIGKSPSSTVETVSMDMLHAGATENKRLRDALSAARAVIENAEHVLNYYDFSLRPGEVYPVQPYGEIGPMRFAGRVCSDLCAQLFAIKKALKAPPVPFEDVSGAASGQEPHLGTVNVVSVNYTTVTMPVLAKSKCGRFSIHNVVLFNGEFSSAYNVTHSETGTAITAGSTLGGGFFWRRLDQCVEFMNAFTAELSLSDIVKIHGKWCVKTRIKVLRDELIQSMTPELTFICVTPNGYAQSDADYVPSFERAESAAITPSEND